MDLSTSRPGFVFESLVMLFQMVALTTLVLARLLPRHRWTHFGKAVFTWAIVGLGVAGSICAHHQSTMGLFAGGSVTFLVVGMIAGNHAAASERTTPQSRAA
jgi:hypothetical protein